jgi:hypothetical protein
LPGALIRLHDSVNGAKEPMPGLHVTAHALRDGAQGGSVPCVDGSLLARVFFTVRLVGCGHVFGLFARFT